MTNNDQFKIGATETLEVLKYMQLEEVSKIDKTLLDILQENSDAQYKFKFDYNLPIKKWNLMPETKNILAMIAYNYWCENEEQRDVIARKLRDNQIEYNKLLDNNTIMVREEKNFLKELFANMLKKKEDKNVGNIYKKITNN